MALELPFERCQDDNRRTDVIISKLFGGKQEYNPKRMSFININYYDICYLCTRVRDILLNEPTLLELRAPLKIFGDIHGQFSDLLHWFRCIGIPDRSYSYLFLGDYVDRGNQSIETICLLFAFKIKFLNRMHLVRGNHEDAAINREYGFYDECRQRFGTKVWRMFNECFNWLPVAALIDRKIFCCHGGLSPHLDYIDRIKQITRPTNVPHSGLLCDLLWSDPERNFKGWGPNQRGVAYVFGADVVHSFLARNNLKLVCRAHEYAEHGFEYFANKSLVTVFSAPDYMGISGNKGAVLLVNENLRCSFITIEPKESRRRLCNLAQVYESCEAAKLTVWPKTASSETDTEEDMEIDH